MPDKWSKIDHLGLAYHVNRAAKDLLHIPVNLLDLQNEIDGNRRVAETIYNALVSQEINYALEPRTSSKSKPAQHIRSPIEILRTLKEGTCLDLALLFSGLCLGYELIPILIVLEGHALVAISQSHTSRSWDRRDTFEHGLFKNALVTADRADQIRELLVSGAYLPIECTGFARSNSLGQDMPEGIGREPDGTMSFERAAVAGLEQLIPEFTRPFKFALDIAVAHYFHEMQPTPAVGAATRLDRPELIGGLQAQENGGPLPYLLDRSDQEKELRKGALRHRALAPRRPLVCLIQGDEYECHREFVLRLHEVSIPSILEYWNPGEIHRTPLMKYRLSLPPFERTSESQWQDLLWEALSSAILKSTGSTQKEVISAVASHHLSIIIELPIFADALKVDPGKRITSILEFWSKWPDMPEGLLLVICLSFKYQKKHRFTGFWRWSKGLNEKIRSCLDEPHQRNMVTVSIPELEPIRQSEAEDVVNNELVSAFYKLTERDVRLIYGRTDLCTRDNRIRMDDLISELLKISNSRFKENLYA